MNIAGCSVYLASSSPRRGQLLEQLGITFQRVKASIDESPSPGELPRSYVSRMAACKLEAAFSQNTISADKPVIAADTVVVLGDIILGKPANEQDFSHMMQQLSGQTHHVLTAVALKYRGCNKSVISDSHVTFRQLTRYDIDSYWRTGEPADKAGGYGIQGSGAQFVSQIIGSYSGIVGLPLFELAQMIRALD